jgi:hypothetical protein
LQEAIEGLALKKPPLSMMVVCNQAKLLADRLEEEASNYDLVYEVVNRLPADLVTLPLKKAGVVESFMRRCPVSIAIDPSSD